MNGVMTIAGGLLLLGSASSYGQPAAPQPRSGQTVPFIVNGGQCEDECDEYMSRQLMGTFASTLQGCKSNHRFYVYGNQIGLEDGYAMMISSSRVQRSEDGTSMLMFLTGNIFAPNDKAIDEQSADASLEYNMETNRLTVSATILPQKMAYLRCRVALPPRYGEQPQ